MKNGKEKEYLSEFMDAHCSLEVSSLISKFRALFKFQDFMQHMSALASLPLSIKRELCMKMVFAVVPEAGTVVMQHNEKLDAWSVIVNGQVQVVRPDGQRFEYKLGDSFGAQPTPTPQVANLIFLTACCFLCYILPQDPLFFSSIFHTFQILSSSF